MATRDAAAGDRKDEREVLRQPFVESLPDEVLGRGAFADWRDAKTRD